MRLLTRSDFDGLTCGAILRELGIIDSWKFVHPKDIQDSLVETSPRDVLANLPYAEGCKLWFDNHSSEKKRLGGSVAFSGESRFADSTARVIYDYYGGPERLARFSGMLEQVDRLCAGRLTPDEILEPEGWTLLGFLTDPRTGLGRFRSFRISNYQLMERLVELFRAADAAEILSDPDVQERVVLYREQSALFRRMLEDYTHTAGDLIITDLRNADVIYTGNRYLIHHFFPKQTVFIWIVNGRGRRNCAIHVGHSIVNPSSSINVGDLLLQFGGGGHRTSGSCQVPFADANRVIEELTSRINEVLPVAEPTQAQTGL